jgi:hypothetical protein
MTPGRGSLRTNMQYLIIGHDRNILGFSGPAHRSPDTAEPIE